MSTKAQLRTAIKLEARIRASSNLDSMVDDIVADIMRDLCNLARYPELLLVDAPITLVAAQKSYALPANFQNLSKARYGRGTVPNVVFRELLPVTDITRRVTNSGLPFYYQQSGANLLVLPFLEIVAADTLLLDYYVDPAALYTADTDPFPVPRLESTVKKSAIARIQRFSAASTEGQQMGMDAGSSFAASQAGSK